MLRPAPKISCCKSYWQKISPLFFCICTKQMASLTFLLTQQRCTLMTCSLQALIAGQNSLKHMFDIWSPDPFCQRLLFVNGCTNARKNKQPWFFFKGSGLKSPLVPKRLCNPKTDACRRGDVGIERAKQK